MTGYLDRWFTVACPTTHQAWCSRVTSSVEHYTPLLLHVHSYPCSIFTLYHAVSAQIYLTIYNYMYTLFSDCLKTEYCIISTEKKINKCQHLHFTHTPVLQWTQQTITQKRTAHHWSLTQLIRTSPTLSVVPSASLWSRKPSTSSTINIHTQTLLQLMAKRLHWKQTDNKINAVTSTTR